MLNRFALRERTKRVGPYGLEWSSEVSKGGLITNCVRLKYHDAILHEDVWHVQTHGSADVELLILDRRFKDIAAEVRMIYEEAQRYQLFKLGAKHVNDPEEMLPMMQRFGMGFTSNSLNDDVIHDRIYRESELPIVSYFHRLEAMQQLCHGKPGYKMDVVEKTLSAVHLCDTTVRDDMQYWYDHSPAEAKKEAKKRPVSERVPLHEMINDLSMANTVFCDAGAELWMKAAKQLVGNQGVHCDAVLLHTMEMSLQKAKARQLAICGELRDMGAPAQVKPLLRHLEDEEQGVCALMEKALRLCRRAEVIKDIMVLGRPNVRGAG